MLKKIFFVVTAVAFLSLLAGAGALYLLVVLSPGEAIRQENIEKILAMESPVYYADGINKVGVFFEEAHRQYVPYAEIPRHFVKAIVAAEDHAFFEHPGIDLPGVLRALLANIRAGRVVQGGSTLSQQAAKNLFKRQGRSLAAKLKELLYALRLEYHYPKEKILEFYANQFYVSGNGRGLGVAARYYFDKSASDLDLLECAFIAGSVKRPNYYNPFLKADEAAVAQTRERAQARVRYVFKQMYKLGMISAEEYQQQIARRIPFRQGRMYFSLNTVMDLVKEGLAEPEVEEALAQAGIDNVATSGIRIYTTVEKDLQDSAMYGLRKELSRLDVSLSGYDQAGLQQIYRKMPFGKDSEQQRRGFLVGEVTEVDAEKPQLTVALDRQNGRLGRVDAAGIRNIVSPWVRYERNAWAEANKADTARFLKKITKGDLVLVSIRAEDGISGEALLDLEKYPRLQGAILALKDGTIRAMVGGMDNKFYNRAVTAKRSMGSVIKPLVYLAALQLGWNNLDILNNERNVFVYQNTPYFPRPDHNSPHKSVSMSWAGVHSENLASVWLLYHLCDQLVPAQFAELIRHLGLAQGEEESYEQYYLRIRDSLGVLVNQETLRQAAFEKAVEQVEPDLLFEGKAEEHAALQNLHYGSGFDKFSEENDRELGRALRANENRTVAECRLRRKILKNNYLRYQRLRENLRGLAGNRELPGGDEALPLYVETKSGRRIYAEEGPAPGWERVSRHRLAGMLAELSPERREQFWDDVLIEGVFTPPTLALLADALQGEYERLSALPPYSGEVLFAVRDFRILAGLTYLTGLCRELGIASKLDPVLSFPLGSNVISLLEAARAYEGLRSGKVFGRGRPDAGEAISIIGRIEDSDGEVIYAPEEHVRKVAEPETVLQVADILRNVVRFGTGNYAQRNVRLHSPDPEREEQLRALDLLVPVFGKTGTANRFTNAAFAGFVPGLGEDGRLVLENGYVLTSYVGYDDNAPMERRTIRLSGASGALPAWVSLANAIFFAGDYAARLDLADLSFAGAGEVPFSYGQLGQTSVRVGDELGGLPAFRDGNALVTTFGERVGDGEIRLARFFKPYWDVEEN
ncbi:transglycosylase domain-containing protein [Thiovibrio sp. JS02]